MNFLFKEKHKNIVDVIDFGKKYNKCFYVMNKYNKTLRDLINNGISDKNILKYFLQICCGLKFVHERNSIHRDLKPENILYDEELDKVAIADFGIAHFDEDDKYTLVDTKKQDRLANFKYHAPEQSGGEICDKPTTDIFALGKILNEMFTNKVIEGTNPKQIKDVCSKYGCLDELVDKMRQQDIYKRCQSIDEVQLLFVCALGEKVCELDFLRELEIDCIAEFVRLSGIELESFKNDMIKKPIFLRLMYNDSNTFVFMSFIKRVMDDYLCRYGNGSFLAVRYVLELIVYILKDEYFDKRNKSYIIFISEEFNNISWGIDDNKPIGKAWQATDFWKENKEDIPTKNLCLIYEISKILKFTSLEKMLLDTIGANKLGQKVN